MQFPNRLTYTVTKDKSSDNVIVSPISIRTCLALLYMGARETTADRLFKGLCLFGRTKETVARPFRMFLDRIKKSGVQIIIANRVYLQNDLRSSHEFDKLATKFFDSSAESVNFSEPEETAFLINSWVEQATEEKIRNIVEPSHLTADTKIILVNAIYFKAKWKNIFDSQRTKRHLFNVTKNLKVPVQMMFQEDEFFFGELTGLSACAIELPYAKSDLSMLIVVPRKIEGLSYLETKLRHVDLTKVRKSLHVGRVKLGLPKFKIDFDISLEPVLKELGMGVIFTDLANFNGLLTMHMPLKVSEVKHKAFIEVDEGGTEAAAATYAKIVMRSSGYKEGNFIIDQPFFFAIIDPRTVYFTGHVAKFL